MYLLNVPYVQTSPPWADPFSLSCIYNIQAPIEENHIDLFIFIIASISGRTSFRSTARSATMGPTTSSCTGSSIALNVRWCTADCNVTSAAINGPATRRRQPSRRHPGSSHQRASENAPCRTCRPRISQLPLGIPCETRPYPAAGEAAPETVEQESVSQSVPGNRQWQMRQIADGA
jgi:hypothetical protein